MRSLTHQPPPAVPDVPRPLHGLVRHAPQPPIADIYVAIESPLFDLTRAAGAGAGSKQAPGAGPARRLERGSTHMPKIRRALVDFVAYWAAGRRDTFLPARGGTHRGDAGSSAPGYCGTGGTLFLRIARLTFDRLGLVDEGESTAQLLIHFGVHGYIALQFVNGIVKLLDLRSFIRALAAL